MRVNYSFSLLYCKICVFLRCCDVNAFLHSGKFIDYMGRTLAADEIEIKSMLLLRRDLYFNENVRGSMKSISHRKHRTEGAANGESSLLELS